MDSYFNILSSKQCYILHRSSLSLVAQHAIVHWLPPSLNVYSGGQQDHFEGCDLEKKTCTQVLPNNLITVDYPCKYYCKWAETLEKDIKKSLKINKHKTFYFKLHFILTAALLLVDIPKTSGIPKLVLLDHITCCLLSWLNIALETFSNTYRGGRKKSFLSYIDHQDTLICLTFSLGVNNNLAPNSSQTV